MNAILFFKESILTSVSTPTVRMGVCARLFSVILMVLCFCAFTNKATAQFGGSGTESSPYLITTPAELFQLGIYVNGNNSMYNDKFYKLVNNIDLSVYGENYNGGKGWNPIGCFINEDDMRMFNGTFDGNGKVISNLYINREEEIVGEFIIVGLFGTTSGTIKNLGVVNAYVNINVNIANDEIVGGGILAGAVFGGNVSNCFSTGIININGVVGGLIGSFMESYLKDCYSNANVSGDSGIGGLVGVIGDSFVMRCYATGTVTGNDMVGGIAGHLSKDAFVVESAALNPSVKGVNSGRMWGSDANTGTYGNLYNVGWTGIININGNTTWNNIGPHTKDGANITTETINYDGTLGGKFTPENGWTTEDGKLPGFGAPAEMPLHLLLNNPFPEGDGSEDNPFLIYTVTQLAALATFTNSGSTFFPNKFYTLMNDIDLSDNPGWVPIGNDYDKPFKGHFNGNNKKITGLYQYSTIADCLGLFGVISGGTINNLGVENVNITGTANIGSIVGTITGKANILNCYATGKVKGLDQLGGLAGYASNSNIKNSYFMGEIGEDGTGGNMGGIVGVCMSACNVSNCYVVGSVKGVGNIGGIAGYVEASDISNCASLHISVKGNADVGRITGVTSSIFSNNVAWNGILNKNDEAIWGNIGENKMDGKNISIEEIYIDGTFGKRFTSANGWTTQNGKLPGLFGTPIDMPKHLLFEEKPFSGGDGSESKPFLITTAYQLFQLGIYVNSLNPMYNDKCYMLGNNIDLSEYGKDYNNGKGWIPIGYFYEDNDSNIQFYGTFNGDGKTISNLYINNDQGIASGLFGIISGTVKNLGIVDCKIVGRSGVGALSGAVMQGTVKNCFSTGSVAGDGLVGGLMGGVIESSVTDCYSQANVNGDEAIGGVFGVLSESIAYRCYATGVVTGNESVGGIVGALSGETQDGIVVQSVSLNPSVKGAKDTGRVFGSCSETFTNINNAGWNEMINHDGNTTWKNIGANNLDGEDITIENIHADSMLGERFTAANGWTTQSGKLPGLFGNAVDMPEHLTMAPTITTTTLPSGAIEIAYNQTLAAIGTAPISWTLEGGNLPDGLNFYGSGAISGTPTTIGIFKFAVKATNSAGSDTKEVTIKIDEVGIAETEISANSITVYPNPTRGELIIEMGDMGYGICDIEIFDIMGKKVSHLTISHPISISHLPAGMYFLRIQTENGMITKKIIKN